MQGLFEGSVCGGFFFKGTGKSHGAETKKSGSKCTEVNVHKDMQFSSTGVKFWSRTANVSKARADSTGDHLQKF